MEKKQALTMSYRSIALFLVIAMLLSSVTGCGSIIPNDTYVLSGKVIDEMGEGMEGVVLSFGEEFDSVTTDSEGRWSKDGLSGAVTVVPQSGNTFFSPTEKELSEAKPGLTFTAIAETIRSNTSPSGKVSLTAPKGVMKDQEITVIVEDIFSNEALGGINVETIVSGDFLEIIIQDQSGEYLPEIIIIDLNNLEDYPMVYVNSIIITVGLIAVGLVKIAKVSFTTYKLVKGGITIIKGGTAIKGGLAKYFLKEVGKDVAIGTSLVIAEAVLKGQKGSETSNSLTIFIMGDQNDEEPLYTIKIPAGASEAEINEAIRELIGDAEMHCFTPAETPSNAYYNDDGTPKIIYAIPVDKLKVNMEWSTVEEQPAKEEEKPKPQAQPAPSPPSTPEPTSQPTAGPQPGTPEYLEWMQGQSVVGTADQPGGTVGSALTVYGGGSSGGSTGGSPGGGGGGGQAPVFRKPVIYLYPEKETTLTVQVDSEWEMIESIPDYDTGWTVTVEPSGRIDNTYDYLFYEVITHYEFSRETGWLIKRANFAEEMDEVLTQLGLSEKEIADFIDYWDEFLCKDCKFFATYLLSPAEVEIVSQISISQEPDSFLRVLFLFLPTDTYLYIEEPELKPFYREGFTVIEWGGMLIE